MKEEKIENLIPELADVALDQAAGGVTYFIVPYAKRCARCRGNLSP